MLGAFLTVLSKIKAVTTLILALVLGFANVEPIRAAQLGVVASDAKIVGGEDVTDFSLRLSEGVTVEVFTLANPYRVILDMPDVSFKLPKSAGRKGEGLVKAYRYGLFAARKARIVIDTLSPVSIEQAVMDPAGGKAVKLKLRLKAIDEESFGSGTGAGLASSHRASTSAATIRPKSSRPGYRPVIVIDPGHGGIDPGTIGPNNIYEKDVVLQVGQALRAELVGRGGFDVKMTRTDDVFVQLDSRLAFSQEKDADLFISLHADAIADKRYVSKVRGATVYTLSERASDEAARKAAEKENSADAIAGLPITGDDGVGEVRDILIDLVKRETANFSADFSNILVDRLGQKIRLSSKPRRAAAFKVLRQTGTPSVLVELGYLSNREDEKSLTSPAWHKKTAQSITRAIESYFARRTALSK